MTPFLNTHRRDLCSNSDFPDIETCGPVLYFNKRFFGCPKMDIEASKVVRADAPTLDIVG